MAEENTKAPEAEAEKVAPEAAPAAEAKTEEAPVKAEAEKVAPEAAPAAEAKAEEAPVKAEAEKVAPQAAPAAEAKAEEAPVKPEAEKQDADAKDTSEKDAESSDESAPRDERRGRRGRSIPAGVAHIRSTFNNTIVTISDARGNVLSWSTAGKAGFKGSRKSTAFAGTMVAQDAARAAIAKGMHEVEVRVQGAGAGRESAVRGIQSAGMHISVIKDVTPIAHNGCRARKRRRV